MDALWKCPKCGRVIREKNLPEFRIIDNIFLYDWNTMRTKTCEIHQERVNMILGKEEIERT